MKIYLLGLPGSGKTTIGKELSNILGLPFIDTDEEICLLENTSIDEIFKTKGEEYFRALERDTLHKLSKKNEFVISTGGGLPCFFDNMDAINQYGTSIFLNVPINTIADRLWTHDNQNRPLLKGKTKEGLIEFLSQKYKERLPYYTKARLEFKGDTINANAIAEKLKELIG